MKVGKKQRRKEEGSKRKGGGEEGKGRKGNEATFLLMGVSEAAE